MSSLLIIWSSYLTSSDFVDEDGKIGLDDTTVWEDTFDELAQQGCDPPKLHEVLIYQAEHDLEDDAVTMRG